MKNTVYVISQGKSSYLNYKGDVNKGKLLRYLKSILN